jgi:hypothetical protein
MTIFKAKKSIRNTSFRYRHNALTAKSVLEVKLLKESICHIVGAIVKAKRQCKNREDHRFKQRIARLKLVLEVLATKFVERVTYAHVDVAPMQRLYRTIDSFEDDEIPHLFRFRSKDQLRALLEGFGVPETVVILPQRYRFSGEEILLVSLLRMSRPYTVWDPVFKTLFGLDGSQIGSAFNWFVKFMTANWGYLMTNNLDYWKPFFSSCAEAIRCKLREWGLENPPANAPDCFCIFGFIDNTMNATMRPGGGPAPDRSRYSQLIQRAWYSGWKKIHGMKFQTVDLPNGMTCDAWGGVSIRHNDFFSLTKSKIVPRLRTLQAGSPVQYKLYGDSIYPTMSHLRSRFDDDHLTAEEITINAAMSACRQSIEWNYAHLKNKFKLLDFTKALKLRLQNVGGMFLLGLILRNALTCMNGNQTAAYFHLMPPTFAHWIGQGPRARPSDPF